MLVRDFCILLLNYHLCLFILKLLKERFGLKYIFFKIFLLISIVLLQKLTDSLITPT